MSENLENTGNDPDEMSEYLQMFLDETEEQIDDLVETMLVLEREPESAAELNETFRLIHSIKGSAGMMGFDNITVLTHRLESRFEQYRSGLERLDQPTMNLVLRCIDFLRECTSRLRTGETLGSAADLLEELRALEETGETNEEVRPTSDSNEPESTTLTANEDSLELLEPDDVSPSSGTNFSIRIVFEAGLQLADLKAQLIASRLAGLGEIKSTQPPLSDLEDIADFSQINLILDTTHSPDEVRKVANVDGVQSIEIDSEYLVANHVQQPQNDVRDDEVEPEKVAPQQEPAAGEALESTQPRPSTESKSDQDTHHEQPFVDTEQTLPENVQVADAQPDPRRQESIAGSPVEATIKDKLRSKVAETVRVDIDRLDNLMNLTGELVVNRARFVQVSRQLSPALRKTNVVNRLRDFSDSLRRTIGNLQHMSESTNDWRTQIQELEAGLELMENQVEVLDNSRRSYGQITEAIDQLTRVSDSLQRGVLETRMVPVGPLFNRFKRVVRDMSVERGKKVNLQIRGEKTELDKRMIDELGDPLIHLVRNSIDHGLEPPHIRAERGKPETGTILLEASHSGNHIYVRVCDDGGGIDSEKIKAKLLDKKIITPALAEELTDEEIIDYIWHPGFSTAKEITDVSGRGVGMDVVKTRIGDLNGTVEVESALEHGTSFTIRLPLTLAIINSLLVRMRDVVFSIPMSDVREIVSVDSEEIVTVHGKQTFDVRGQFIPLVDIESVFEWHSVQSDHRNAMQESQTQQDFKSKNSVNVVVLQLAGKTMGLRVDELLGGQEIVIKSLSDNFVSIRGLAGASILGDGAVCLMLDVATVIDMAARSSSKTEKQREMQLESIG